MNKVRNTYLSTLRQRGLVPRRKVEDHASQSEQGEDIRERGRLVSLPKAQKAGHRFGSISSGQFSYTHAK